MPSLKHQAKLRLGVFSAKHIYKGYLDHPRNFRHIAASR